MQTKKKIQQLLVSAGVSPNTRLGQHFLIDLNLMQVLLDAARVHSNDVILEVGAGTGSLTEALADCAGKLISVEIDDTLAQIVKKQLSEYQNVTVLNTDILQSKNTICQEVAAHILHARQQYSGRFLLIGNLPYNIASAIMINLTTGPDVADAMYVTIQKEVARRMTAAPGNKDYGTLSIFLAVTGNVKLIRTLKPTVFWPQPQVDSAMVSFTRKREKVSRIHDMKIFTDVVNLFMQHRRKMLKACAKFAEGKLTHIHDWFLIFEDCCIDPHQRPEQLSPENFLSIANLCCEHLKTV